MATLAGTRVKDTYQGMLKTSDASSLTTSLKVIEDGIGNSSALSLSTTTVKAESLEINTVTSGSTSGNALVWNSTSKAVEYRAFPSNETVTTTVGGSTSPTITIEAADASSTTVTFSTRNGLQYTRSGNTITVGRGDETITDISVDTTLGSTDSGTTYYVTNLSGTLDITLPTAAAGVNFKIILKKISGGEVNILTRSGDYFFGKAVVTSNAATGQSRAKTLDENTSNNVINLDPDGSDSGGNTGDVIDLLAIDADNWLVNASLTTSSATVGALSVFPTP
jgi:hypothetical protein